MTSDWRPISEAPRDGREVLLYRPLAHLTGDEHVTIRRTTPYNNDPWPATVPEGCKAINFNEGLCYASHWMPLPPPPSSENQTP